MADVFISYSKKSRDMTEVLANELERKGVTVWWDTSLVLGERFREVILRELAQARAVIVIWTLDSVNSDWVIGEAERGRARGILIPVRDPKLHVDAIPPPFDALHTDVVSNRAAIYAGLSKLGVELKQEEPAMLPPSSGPAATEAPLTAVRTGHEEATKPDRGTTRQKPTHATALVVLEGHKGEIEEIELSSDGSRVLTKAKDKTARLWDSKTGGWITTFGYGTKYDSFAAFSFDGARVIICDDESGARLCDAKTGAELHILHDHGPAESDTTSKGLLSRFFKAEHRAKPEKTGYQRIAGLNRLGPQIAVLDKSNSLEDAKKEGLSLWNANTGARIARLRWHEGTPPHAISFSHDGSQAISADGLLWDTATGTQIAVLNEGGGGCAVFSQDGSRAVVAGAGGEARLWDPKNRTLISVLKAHEEGVTSAVFSCDGLHMLTLSDNGRAFLWNAQIGFLIAILRGDKKYMRSGYTAVFSRDGSQVITSMGDPRLWDVATGRLIGVFKADKLNDQFAPDFNAVSQYGSRVLTISSSERKERDFVRKVSRIQLWDGRTGHMIAELVGHKEPPASAVFSVDETLVAVGGKYAEGHVWNAKTGASVAGLDRATHILFPADASGVLTTHEDKATIWALPFEVAGSTDTPERSSS